MSGEPRLEHDPRVADFAAHADALVASYDYSDFLVRMGPVHDDQGTGDERPYDLVVRFDHAKIDAVLSSWEHHPGGAAARKWCRCSRSSDFPGPKVKAGAEQRGSLAAAATQYGLPLRVPSEAELASWGVAPSGAPNPRAEPQEGRALVAGTLYFDQAKPGWVGAWQMRWRGADYAWEVSGKITMGVPLPNAGRSVSRLRPRLSRLRLRRVG